MSRFRFVLPLFLLAGTSLALALDSPSPTAPVAKRIPHELELHGETRTDDYFWMKDRRNPQVLEYLKAENAYTSRMLRHTEQLRKKLYQESLSRIKQTDQDVPVRDRGYWYYSRTLEGKQYPIHCRKKGNLDAVEQVLLDGNELARGRKFFSFGEQRVSDDGTRLAFAVDTAGSREYRLSVKDLGTGKVVETDLVRSPQFEWAADNRTLFYLTEDDARRAHRLWRHTIGQPRERDVLVYEEKDELFWLELSRSRDRKYLFLSSVSYGSTEQQFLPSDDPAGKWKLISAREPRHEYEASHRDGRFYIRTNRNATNFKVCTCPVENTSLSGWTDLAPYDPAVYIESLSLFAKHAVISTRVGGSTRLIVRDLESSNSHPIAFEGKTYDVHLSQNPEFGTRVIRFTYSSLAEPDIDYSYDMDARVRTMLKATEVPGGYRADDYVMERIHAASRDGTRVPISLIYRKGLKLDGTSPCLLHGYGAYGLNETMAFDPARVSLLDRGVVWAHAHVRGGSDLGRTWYDDGKMLKKMNSFEDFIACADHLVNAKYCSRDRLAIEGSSAGGLLIAAALNLRPNLCKAAVLGVPFVDALTSMSDESIPLTVQEFQQWGNPKVKAEYDYLRKYCPYTNLRKQAYPAMLVMTSLEDSQVLFHEPTKYVAKLRTLKTDKNPLLFRCNMDAGHGGASGRYDQLEEEALVHAFLLDHMGIEK
jgi:oligopeptidase B